MLKTSAPGHKKMQNQGVPVMVKTQNVEKSEPTLNLFLSHCRAVLCLQCGGSHQFGPSSCCFGIRHGCSGHNSVRHTSLVLQHNLPTKSYPDILVSLCSVLHDTVMGTKVCIYLSCFLFFFWGGGAFCHNCLKQLFHDSTTSFVLQG